MKTSSTLNPLISRLIITILGIILGFFVFALSCSYLLFGPVEVRFLSFSLSLASLTRLWEERSNWFGFLFSNSIEVCFSILLGLAIAIIFFTVGSLVQRSLSNKRTIIHGSSRWATIKDLKERGLLSSKGIVMGQTDDARYGIQPIDKPKRRKEESSDDYKTRLLHWKENKSQTVMTQKGRLISTNKNEHILIVGATRSGKGVSCIIPTEFSWSESMIVFDPKCEGWGITSSFRSQFSYTFKFQPENPHESIHYNPLLSIRRGTNTIPDIQNLCFSLIVQNDNARDPFWDEEGRRLLTAIIGFVIYAESPEKKNLKQVSQFFTNPDALPSVSPDSPEAKLPSIKRRLLEYTKRLNQVLLDSYSNDNFTDDDRININHLLREFDYFLGTEERQLSSVISTLTSKLQVIADPNVQAVTEYSDFCFDDFVNGVEDKNGVRHPISLYLCSSLSSIQRLTPIIRIFYEQAITLLTRSTPEECSKRPYRLLLIFDEFRQMGRMDIVERALSLSAGYGVISMIVVQSYEQLKTIYQSEAIFTDNIAHQIILKVSDPNTCKKVEEMLGKSTVQRNTSSFSGQSSQIILKGTNISSQEYGRSLMTAEEIRTMNDDDMLIISSGSHPYRGKKIRYYLDSRFIPLYKDTKDNPLPLPSLSDNLPHPEGSDPEGWLSLQDTIRKKTKETPKLKKDHKITPIHDVVFC